MLLYERGDWRRPGPQVAAAFPRIANLASKQALNVNAESQRLELARWMTDRENPLVARSIVNRVWQFHFGRGLSATPSDFGLMGQEPTHPDLLDFLAAKLVDGRWSLKELHRQILLSSFYQMSSRAGENVSEVVSWHNSLEQDPDNLYLTRFPRRRLDAESIRDAMLAVAGLLNYEPAGPGVRPPLPSELVKTLKSGQWKVSDKRSDHYRRSVYLFARRNLIYPLFATFDRPAANCSCAQRHSSTTPLQSLLLLNSAFTHEIANQLSEVILNEVVSSSPQNRSLMAQLEERSEYIAEAIFKKILNRKPTLVESHQCQQFLKAQFRIEKDESENKGRHAAITDLCIALLNSNSFIYVD
jgi:hypothetical protein